MAFSTLCWKTNCLVIGVCGLLIVGEVATDAFLRNAVVRFSLHVAACTINVMAFEQWKKCVIDAGTAPAEGIDVVAFHAIGGIVAGHMIRLFG